ncbi:hypothetical protein OG874_26710 [Nocardia sp. NBC_00565]|uniref:hypothetical protein n=1 Tax=Nocardia sp. NBC_00565 TaxID=2975993 RepID=UPI002E7FE878|nr:hypothetical protein [Nocardia sp. NBC_00565]WUC00466.1 hypothetical protein OG874_26710 [Nocardia sp. NBC_00565]
MPGDLPTSEVAARRIRQRHRDNPLRQAHSDPQSRTSIPPAHAFDRVSVDAPSLDVDTTDGYHPTLDEIVAFINNRMPSRQ